MIAKDLKILAELSSGYGSSVDWVQAAGGNTSVKVKDRIYIKKSGIRLKEVNENEGYLELKLSRKNIEEVCTNSLVDIERNYKELIDSILVGRTTKPSIELSFHTLGQKFTVHTHPTQVNIFGCSVEGSKMLETLFLHKEILMVPYVKPGIVLTRNILILLKGRNTLPELTVLLNHGLVVTADTPGLIHKYTHDLMDLLAEIITPEPTVTAVSQDVPGFIQAHFKEMMICGIEDENLEVHEKYNGLVLYPDMAVFCGRAVLVVGEIAPFETQLQNYTDTFGAPPKVLLVKGKYYVLGRNNTELEFITEVFCNHAKVLKNILKKNWTPVFLTGKQIDELLDWDLEKYRQELLKK
jgi:rhamnose utilization protein RhaD (predicted bifunctional aldolase and dehydrogenase)